MKKLLAALLLLPSLAFADGHFGGYHGGYHDGYRGFNGHGYPTPYRINQGHYYRGYGSSDILVPMVLGGVVGYAIRGAQEPQVVYQQPPVVYQQPSTTVYQKCTPWTETIDQYGVTTRTRTCY
jgi:hypothetical protein